MKLTLQNQSGFSSCMPVRKRAYVIASQKTRQFSPEKVGTWSVTSHIVLSVSFLFIGIKTKHISKNIYITNHANSQPKIKTIVFYQNKV